MVGCRYPSGMARQLHIAVPDPPNPGGYTSGPRSPVRGLRMRCPGILGIDAPAVGRRFGGCTLVGDQEVDHKRINIDGRYCKTGQWRHMRIQYINQG